MIIYVRVFKYLAGSINTSVEKMRGGGSIYERTIIKELSKKIGRVNTYR